MHEKEKIDNVKENSSNDNNKNIKNENEQEKEKILENVDIDKIVNIDEDLNSSYVDEKEDFKKSNKNQFNVILIGDSNVGKTSILKKFITGSFNQKIQCTIDVEFSSKNLKIDKNLYAELKIFDTAGQEKYRALTKSYYRNVNGVILVFDLTDENALIKLKSWMTDISENTANVEIILVGNKTDLKDRRISKTEAENFAKENNYKYIETSAKDGTNILLLFEELAIDMNKRKQEESSYVEIKSINTYVFRRSELNKQLKSKKESKCC